MLRKEGERREKHLVEIFCSENKKQIQRCRKSNKIEEKQEQDERVGKCACSLCVCLCVYVCMRVCACVCVYLSVSKSIAVLRESAKPIEWYNKTNISESSILLVQNEFSIPSRFLRERERKRERE